MLQNSPEKWFLINDQLVEGLGHAELSHSWACPSEFQATLVLNNYESNCLRDWLSQRWLAKSLEQTCIFELEYSKLLVSRRMSANNVLDAKEKCELWIQAVLADRVKVAQSRG